MRKLNNQPVNFKVDPFENPYVDSVKYEQLVQQGDITQFQFGTAQDNASTNIIENSTFTNDLNSWYQPYSATGQNFSQYNGVLFYKEIGDDRTAGEVRQDALVVGSQYECKIKIIDSYLGFWEVYFGTNRVAQLTSGVHIVAGICEGINQFKLRFVPTVTEATTTDGSKADQVYITSVGSVDWLIITPKTTVNHRFVISDLDDNTVTYNFNAIADYLADPYTSSSYAQFQMNTLTMAVDWTTFGITNGCHRIGVCDADVNTNMQCGARNSEFFGSLEMSVDGDVTLPQWTLSTTLTGSFESKKKGLKMLGGATSLSTCKAKQLGLTSGITYDFELYISEVTGVPGVTLEFGSTVSSTFTTVGIHTGQITSNGGGLNVIMKSAPANETATIGYIRIQAVASDLAIDYYSNPFALQTTHHRTFVINANNTDNVFGLNYESVIWSPRARLRGYIAPSDNAYNTERETSETSYGKRQVYYYKRRKAQLMIIENEPEFMHDWLSILGGHDHIVINNVEHFYDDDEYPSITWDYWRLLGSTQVPISLKQSLERKTIKGGIKNAQFLDDLDGNGIDGGFLGGTFGGLTPAEYSGGTVDPDPLIDPSDSTGGTAVISQPSATVDELDTTGTDGLEAPKEPLVCDYC